MVKKTTKYKNKTRELVASENTATYNPSNNYDEIFKKIWATLDYLTQKHKEWEEELEKTRLEREQKEKEYQEELKRIQLEREKREQESEKKYRQLESLFIGQWGKLIEALVNGNLENILKERNIDISTTTQRVKSKYEGKDVEFDIVAHNGEDIVVVEVKTTLKVEHVKDFIEELKLFKKIFPVYQNKNVYGAVAFLVVEEEADKYAYKQGLFVIKATSESARIMNDQKFQPQKW